MLKWAEIQGRARDQLIAEKVFGKQSTNAGDGRYVLIKDMGSIKLPDGRLPNYTTSMDDAWLVVEKMLDKAVFTCEVGAWENESKYVVITFDRTPAQNERRTSAPTMPEAICLAALRVAGVEVE